MATEYSFFCGCTIINLTDCFLLSMYVCSFIWYLLFLSIINKTRMNIFAHKSFCVLPNSPLGEIPRRAIMGWKTMNFSKALTSSRFWVGSWQFLLLEPQCCLLLQSHCAKILAPKRRKCSQTNLVVLKKQNGAPVTMKGTVLNFLFQI